MTAKAITTTSPDRPQPLPSLLANLVADPVVPVYGDHGFDTRAGTWSPPAVVTEPVRLAARSALDQHDRLLDVKATPRQATEWLLSLMMLTGGRQLSTDEAKVKSAAFAQMLTDYPAALFTRESLHKAGAEFKFFPAYAELTEMLDRDLRRLKREQQRLAILAALPKSSTADTVVRSAVRRMPEKASDAKPEKASAVVHPPSAEQLAEWAKAVGA